jgi:exopolysaccharide biosynthesis protein
MKNKKIFLSIFSVFILIISIFLYMNRDKFAYVGSVDIIEVDCSKKHQILSEVYESDFRIRKSNELIKYAKEDHRNQELVISILEKCGMPTLNEVTQKHMTAIWIVLQHTNKKYRKKYFPQIEEAVKNGDLFKEQYALMKDRILMDDDKPQIYGSQLKNGKLYKLENPETVNERRKKMGMGTIEDYLKNFNIQFNPN